MSWVESDAHLVLEYFDETLCSTDPLGFPGYAAQLAKLGSSESVTTGRTQAYVFIRGEFSVLGGSMGAVHGERVVRAFDRATELGLPVLIETRSGGARMQEGMLALIQMARTAAASERHRSAGLTQFSYFDDPTTGGVFASYGSLATHKFARPHAYVGFGGPRVLEAFGVAPEQSHTAESAERCELIDAIMTESEFRDTALAAISTMAQPASQPVAQETSLPFGSGSQLRNRPTSMAWDVVQAARSEAHPAGVAVATRVSSEWAPLPVADPTVVCATANIGGKSVVIIANDRRFELGRPGPAAYRAARDAMDLAQARGVPVVSFIDMPGADPSAASENGGIAQEIAKTFAKMMSLTVPTVAIVTGEGGSGGALALACGDQFGVCADGFFSVIAPEGAAAILDRDVGRAAARADDLRLVGADLVQLGIADSELPDAGSLQAESIVRLLEDAAPGQCRERWNTATMRALR